VTRGSNGRDRQKGFIATTCYFLVFPLIFLPFLSCLFLLPCFFFSILILIIIAQPNSQLQYCKTVATSSTLFTTYLSFFSFLLIQLRFAYVDSFAALLEVCNHQPSKHQPEINHPLDHHHTPAYPKYKSNSISHVSNSNCKDDPIPNPKLK